MMDFKQIWFRADTAGISPSGKGDRHLSLLQTQLVMQATPTCSAGCNRPYPATGGHEERREGFTILKTIKRRNVLCRRRLLSAAEKNNQDAVAATTRAAGRAVRFTARQKYPAIPPNNQFNNFRWANSRQAP